MFSIRVKAMGRRSQLSRSRAMGSRLGLSRSGARVPWGNKLAVLPSKHSGRARSPGAPGLLAWLSEFYVRVQSPSGSQSFIM